MNALITFIKRNVSPTNACRTTSVNSSSRRLANVRRRWCQRTTRWRSTTALTAAAFSATTRCSRPTNISRSTRSSAGAAQLPCSSTSSPSSPSSSTGGPPTSIPLSSSSTSTCASLSPTAAGWRSSCPTPGMPSFVARTAR